MPQCRVGEKPREIFGTLSFSSYKTRTAERHKKLVKSAPFRRLVKQFPPSPTPPPTPCLTGVPPSQLPFFYIKPLRTYTATLSSHLHYSQDTDEVWWLNGQPNPVTQLGGNLRVPLPIRIKSFSGWNGMTIWEFWLRLHEQCLVSAYIQRI